jgi:hypothetical protein
MAPAVDQQVLSPEHRNAGFGSVGETRDEP